MPPESPTPACTCAEQNAQAAKIMVQPVIPARFAGGIDAHAGAGGAILTLDEVQQGFTRADFTQGPVSYPGGPWKMCDGQALGDFLGDGEISLGWGTNQEIFANFSAKTKKLNSIWMQPGYLGTMTCYSRPGGVFEKDGPHTYELTIGSRVTRDQVPLDFASSWTTDKTNPASFLNELYDACIATYGPTIAPEAGVVDGNPLGSCAVTGHCVLGQFSDGSNYWFVTSIGFGWLVSDITSGPDVATTPINFQMYVK